MRIGVLAALAVLLSGVIAFVGDEEHARIQIVAGAGASEGRDVLLSGPVLVLNEAIQKDRLLVHEDGGPMVGNAVYAKPINLPDEGRRHIGTRNDGGALKVRVERFRPVSANKCAGSQPHMLRGSLSEILKAEGYGSVVRVDRARQLADINALREDVDVGPELFGGGLGRQLRGVARGASQPSGGSGAVIHRVGAFGGELHGLIHEFELLFRSFRLPDSLFSPLFPGGTGFGQGFIVSLSAFPGRLGGMLGKVSGSDSGNGGKGREEGGKSTENNLRQRVVGLSYGGGGRQAGDAVGVSADSEALRLVGARSRLYGGLAAAAGFGGGALTVFGGAWLLLRSSRRREN